MNFSGLAHGHMVVLRTSSSAQAFKARYPVDEAGATGFSFCTDQLHAKPLCWETHGNVSFLSSLSFFQEAFRFLISCPPHVQQQVFQTFKPPREGEEASNCNLG